jgi:hypothetical protein
MMKVSSQQTTRGFLLPKRKTATSVVMMRSKMHVFSIAAAAAFSTSAHAWVLMPNSRSISFLPFPPVKRFSPHLTSTTGLYHSSPLRQRDNQKDEKGGGGFFGQLEKAAKTFLPKKWFGSDEEKAKLTRQRQVKDQVKDSIDEMLRGAPLGIRMMGKMVAPLMGSVASTLEEGFVEQQRATEAIMDDAREYLLSDSTITDAMGTPIQLGAPFSQSSSMTSVNGKTQSRMELALNISGPKRSGIARIIATESGISQLLVESGGKMFNVNLSSKGKGRARKNNFGSRDDDNIIEAEIIEKDTNTNR